MDNSIAVTILGFFMISMAILFMNLNLLSLIKSGAFAVLGLVIFLIVYLYDLDK